MYKKTLKTYKQRLFVYFLLLLNTLSSCRWQVGECGYGEYACQCPGAPGHGRYVDDEGLPLDQAAQLAAHSESARNRPPEDFVTSCNRMVGMGLLAINKAMFNRSVFHCLANTASSPDLTITELLIQQRAAINDIDYYGDTPLSLAVQNGHLDLARSLINAGASLNFKHKHNYSLLHLSSLCGHMALAQYLVEEVHLPVITISKHGETPLDIAIKKNHTEIIKYFNDIRDTLLKNFASAKEPIRAQLMHHFSTSGQESLQQLQEALHLPPHVLTPENLAHQAILGIQDFLQGTYPFMPLSASASSGSGEPRNNAGNIHQTEADDLAKQILDEFEKKKDLLSSEQQEELKQIKVEDLRPYTTILIETLEKLKHLEENEIPAEVDEASDEEPIIHPIEPNKDDMLQQQIYVPLLEQQHPPTTIALQYVIPTTYAFIPNYRTGNVNRIKQGFTRLKTRLDIFKTSILPKKEKLHLSEMHAKNIKYLLDEIQTEEKELIPLYRNIKSRISKCGGDSLFLTQDTSQFKEYELEKFKHEAAILQTAIDDVAHARKLLVDLGDIKQALRQILMDQDILYNVAYRLRKCGISKIITAQMLKLCAMQHNADIFASPSIISTLLDCVPEDELSNFENDYSEQELHAYFQSLKKVVSTDREKHFVALLHHRDHSAFASIMQRLGQPEPISKQDFVDLLHASTPCWDDIISAFSFRTKEMVLPLDDSIKYFAQITKQIINQSTTLPLGKTMESAALFAGIISLGHFASTPRLITVEERISYITPMILQAIIQSTPRPLGNTIMLTSMQEIKKRVHKLTGAIEQKLTQPILMLTNGNA